MDYGLIFPYRFDEGNGRTQVGYVRVPNGHGASPVPRQESLKGGFVNLRNGGKWSGNTK